LANSNINRSRFKLRHLFIVLSFLIFVIIPFSSTTWYLYTKAQDQFTSTVAFTVRSEEMSSAIDILGGLNALGSAGSSDTDVLYEFVRSRAIVEKVNENLNLKEIYSRPYSVDPWFSFDPAGTIEDLVKYWNDMVKVYYDRNTGMIEIRVHGFNSIEAQKLSSEILKESSIKINKLNDIARSDAIKYSSQELELSLNRLRVARSAMTEFRSTNKLVSPETELALQTGVLSALQGELSSLLIEIDMLADISSNTDPRKLEYEQRIKVIEKRIEQERLKFSSKGLQQSSYGKLLGEFEILLVDREYAEQLYLGALASYDASVTKFNRKSRYLATYIEPTLAERAEYPEKKMILFLTFIVALFSWATAILLFYAVRDKQ